MLEVLGCLLLDHVEQPIHYVLNMMEFDKIRSCGANQGKTKVKK